MCFRQHAKRRFPKLYLSADDHGLCDGWQFLGCQWTLYLLLQRRSLGRYAHADSDENKCDQTENMRMQTFLGSGGLFRSSFGLLQNQQQTKLWALNEYHQSTPNNWQQDTALTCVTLVVTCVTLGLVITPSPGVHYRHRRDKKRRPTLTEPCTAPRSKIKLAEPGCLPCIDGRAISPLTLASAVLWQYGQLRLRMEMVQASSSST